MSALLPGASTCCNSCEDSTTTTITLAELIAAQGCQTAGSGPPTSIPAVGCTYWDYTNKILYQRDLVDGLPAWREIIA
jgi:hypothetical protein